MKPHLFEYISKWGTVWSSPSNWSDISSLQFLSVLALGFDITSVLWSYYCQLCHGYPPQAQLQHRAKSSSLPFWTICGDECRSYFHLNCFFNFFFFIFSWPLWGAHQGRYKPPNACGIYKVEKFIAVMFPGAQSFTAS